MGNIVNENIDCYIDSLIPSRDKNLSEFREDALFERVPIIDLQVEEFLKMQLEILQPRSVLELGTATGYSAIMMATFKEDITIDTVELNPDRAIQARKNLHEWNLEDRISLYVMDAGDYLKTSQKSYDLIFIDAAKGSSESYFHDSMNLLNKGGTIIMDNALFHGMIAPGNPYLRRKITIIKRLRRFLRDIMADDTYLACLYPIGDGILMVRRRNG